MTIGNTGGIGRIGDGGIQADDLLVMRWFLIGSRIFLCDGTGV